MADFLTYIRARKAQLKQELQELEAAERIFLESSSRQNSMPGQQASASMKRSSRVESVGLNSGIKTIKQQIRVLLDEANPAGLSAQEILHKIRNRWTPTLERTSLSPQLSRLRKEGVIFNRNNVWYIY